MRIVIDRMESAFDGVAFGNIGPYEKIVGRVFAEIDPMHRQNAGIVNLERAPRNANQRVDYSFDFYLLKPRDLRRGARRLLYDVNNRGNKLALDNLNDAPRINDPTTAPDAGNGFLMRHGYALLWSGWQGDLAAGDDRLLARLPIATDHGSPIVGMSREEFIFEHDRSPTHAPLTYPAATLDPQPATLTVRQREQDARVSLSPGHWRYVSPTRIAITRPTGFDAGAIYEFIYPARDPIVMGIGFAAVRDFVAFMRHERADSAGTANPLWLEGEQSAVDYTLAYGASQSGRFLRDFLWQGFNQDLEGRKVFDGVMPSVAGSRKAFINFQFAQPGRFPRQHEDHLFPGDQFPFSYATITDPVSGKTDGLLERCKASGTCPKIVQTEGSTDFWEGRAGLIVTDGQGKDVQLPDNVRVYLFASAQHGGGAVAAHFPFHHYPANPTEYSCAHRALLVALDEWVSRDVPPPPSRFPRVNDGTLVPPSPASYGFPAIPGMTYPGLVNRLSEMDYSVQPPRPIPGREYVVLVPRADADGNDVAGLRVPEVMVPRGTHTGWNLRREGFAPGELILLGSFFPFAATRAERTAAGDPRPSLAERYPEPASYAQALAAAVATLRRERLLLDDERFPDEPLPDRPAASKS